MGRQIKYKKPAAGEGKKVDIYLRAKHLKMWRQIENRSGFVQMCLEDAVGIMTWNMMKQRDPKRFPDPHADKKIEDVVGDFNIAYPLDPLTKARKAKDQSCESSPKPPEIW